MDTDHDNRVGTLSSYALYFSSKQPKMKFGSEVNVKIYIHVESSVVIIGTARGISSDGKVFEECMHKIQSFGSGVQYNVDKPR